MATPSLPFVNHNESVQMPVGGGDFVPSGMIALWKAQVMYGFWSETDPGLSEETPTPDLIFKKGRGWQLYYVTEQVANGAGKSLGQQYNSKETWIWTSARNSVLNIPDPEDLAKFSDPIAFDHCQITSLQSKKYRHEFHMIALPSAIAASARLLGYEVPDVSFSNLLSSDTIFDDALFERLVGNSDVDKNEDDPKHFTKSELWTQRAVTWSALGEKNSRAYFPIGSKDAKGNNTKYNTTSDKLSSCLAVLKPWKNAFWAKLVTVQDPRVDATYGEDETKRLRIPALFTFYPNEQAARAAAKEELAERAKREASKKQSDNGASGGDLVPSDWATIPDDWWKKVAELKTEYAGKPPPIVLKALKTREEELAATADQVYAAMKAK